MHLRNDVRMVRQINEKSTVRLAGVGLARFVLGAG